MAAIVTVTADPVSIPKPATTSAAAAAAAVGITRSLLAAAVVLELAGFLKDRGVRLRL